MAMNEVQAWITIIVGGLIFGVVFGWMLYKLAMRRNKKRLIKEAILSQNPEAKIVLGGKKFANKDVDMILDGKKVGMDGQPKGYKNADEFVEEMDKQPIIPTKKKDKVVELLSKVIKEPKRIKVPSRKELQGGKK